MMNLDKTGQGGEQGNPDKNAGSGGPLRLDLPPAAGDDTANPIFAEPLPDFSESMSHAASGAGMGRAACSAGGHAGNPGGYGGEDVRRGPGGGGPFPPYGWCCSAPHPQRPWRKRHPFLFWTGVIVLLLVLGNLLGYVIGDRLGGPRIAVVNIEGAIMGSRDVNAWIEEVRVDPQVAGVLLRVNSPGGGVGASQEIYYAVSRLAKAKPVVVSMGTVAASGGYYVSLPARRIFAVPSTLTGSIGVKMSLTNMEELMKTLGVSSTTLTTGALKDAGSPFREMTPEERAYLQAIIDDMFNDFVAVVAKHRNLSRDKVLAVSDGRGITGRQALEDKLVDELGDMYDALSYLKKECGLDPQTKVKLVEGPEEEGGFWRKLILSVIRESAQQAGGEPVFLY